MKIILKTLFLFAMILTVKPKDLVCDRIRVMTLNLSSNFEMKSSINDLIKKEKPDLISLQEAIWSVRGASSGRRRLPSGGVTIIQDMAKKLGYEYSFGYGVDEEPFNELRYWGPVVLSKRKILSTKRIPLGGRRVLVEVIVNTGSKPLKFYATHLPPYWWPGYGFSLNRIKESFVSRQKLIRNMVKFLKQDLKNTVLAGDFNSLNFFHETKPIEDIMNDTYIESGGLFGATYPSYIPFVRVDYIFASKDIKVRNCRTSSYIPDSDHRAVIADLEY
ncbi:MAG: endonuclease/exonuclease/phosphatase family protein [Spirochaetes bacterium]|nr:endonuclease/exonuclease/phosphatase family protein [Spirochaetota bacterium]